MRKKSGSSKISIPVLSQIWHKCMYISYQFRYRKACILRGYASIPVSIKKIEK